MLLYVRETRCIFYEGGVVNGFVPYFIVFGFGILGLG